MFYRQTHTDVFKQQSRVGAPTFRRKLHISGPAIKRYIVRARSPALVVCSRPNNSECRSEAKQMSEGRHGISTKKSVDWIQTHHSEYCTLVITTPNCTVILNFKLHCIVVFW